MNIACTKEYQEYRKEREWIFCRKYQKDEPKKEDLNEEWSISTCRYEGMSEKYGIHGSSHQLLDRQGNICFEWKNINNDGEFYQIVHHQDGTDYLIFRQDLYGYSVLQLNSMQALHYIPDESYYFGEGEYTFRETFIWTKVNYHTGNNLMAVEGCIWASPFSVIILDFSKPLDSQERWVEAHEIIDAEYELYDDIDFERWAEDGIVLKALKADSCKIETIIITWETLWKFLKK